jgi:hypothetical protein
MCFADKSGKVWEKGVKTMPFMDKDLVLTTKNAIKYLKISPLFQRGEIPSFCKGREGRI